jgi:rfaE bifunctional protein kinase chain/domain
MFITIARMRILIIGDVMLDDYIIGEVNRMSPEAPVPVLNIKSRNVCLGGAANVALNVKALGATPILCSVIGSDEKSRDLLALMRAEFLSEQGISKSSDRIVTVKYRAMGNNTQLLRMDTEVTHPLLPKDEKLFLNTITDIIKTQRIDAIIFEDYDKGVITPAVIRQVTELAIQKSIPIAVDPKKRNFLHYKNITLFKPNYKELADGLHLEKYAWDDPHLLDAIQQFMINKRHQYLLLTLSGNGLLMCHYSNAVFTHKYLPARLRNVADTSGAGDTVISAAILCILSGLEMERTAIIANLAGGLVCEEIGVVAIDREKLFVEMQDIL